jgi:hypothetical protein
MKHKWHHTGTQSAAACPPPPRRMCYRAAVFIRHHNLKTLSFPQVIIRHTFQRSSYLNLYFLRL